MARSAGELALEEARVQAEAAEYRANRGYQEMRARMFSAMLDGSCKVAGLRGHGRTLADLQAFRTSWANLDVAKQIKVCRNAVQNNWYAGMVHNSRLAVYGHGFRFSTEAAREYAGMEGAGLEERYEAGSPAAYPWADVVNDILYDYLAVDNVVAMWRKGLDELPHIVVYDAEDVQYSAVGGVKKITLNVERNAAMAVDTENRAYYVKQLGERMYDACCRGGELTVVRGQDPDWNFDVLTRGKRRAEYVTPSLVAVLDDLDFLEMVKVGDWNGAYTRKDIFRTATKGSGVSSGSNAGRPMNNATPKNLRDLKGAMEKSSGLTNWAQNWDTKLGFEVFPAEFFGEDLCKDAVKRLVAWGGLHAAMLMDGFSQVSGISPYMARLERPCAQRCRRDVAEFCERIFNDPSFRRNDLEIKLVPEFNDSVLYNTEELVRLVEHQLSHAVISAETARRIHGVDSKEESSRIRASHDDPLGFTPVHEPRQGMVQFVRGGDGEGGTVPPASGPGGEGGRPPKI